MDIVQIRTFLAIAQTGSFVGAADVVHVSQSTVSVRIRTLEEELRTNLFERSKKGAVLSGAGRKFLRTASAMTQLWDQAKMDISLSEGHVTSIRVGGQVSLWDGYLIPWLLWMNQNAPTLALRAQMADPLLLSRRLVDGALDVAVMYRPQYRPGFFAEQIFTEEVVLVSSCPKKRDYFDNSYVLTYWGPEFQEDHALNFPNLTTPRLSVDLGTMGIKILLQQPSSGYFPKRIVESLITNGRLTLVEGAPSFSYPAYAVFSNILAEDITNTILDGLRTTAASLMISNL